MGRISRSNRGDVSAALIPAHPATIIRKLDLRMLERGVLQQLANYRGACDGGFGRSFIPPSVWVREAGVIEAKRVQERRLQVGNAHTIDGGLVSEIVGRTVLDTAFDTATCEPQGKPVVIVIAPVRVPATVGVNVTVTVQVAFCASVAAQLFVWLKSPVAAETAMLLMPPLFAVSVTVCEALVVFVT